MTKAEEKRIVVRDEIVQGRHGPIRITESIPDISEEERAARRKKAADDILWGIYYARKLRGEI